MYSNLPADTYTVVARDPALAPDYAYEEYEVVIESSSDIILMLKLLLSTMGILSVVLACRMER